VGQKTFINLLLQGAAMRAYSHTTKPLSI